MDVVTAACAPVAGTGAGTGTGTPAELGTAPAPPPKNMENRLPAGAGATTGAATGSAAAHGASSSSPSSSAKNAASTHAMSESSRPKMAASTSSTSSSPGAVTAVTTGAAATARLAPPGAALAAAPSENGTCGTTRGDGTASCHSGDAVPSSAAVGWCRLLRTTFVQPCAVGVNGGLPAAEAADLPTVGQASALPLDPEACSATGDATTHGVPASVVGSRLPGVVVWLNAGHAEAFGSLACAPLLLAVALSRAGAGARTAGGGPGAGAGVGAADARKERADDADVDAEDGRVGAASFLAELWCCGTQSDSTASAGRFTSTRGPLGDPFTASLAREPRAAGADACVAAAAA